MNPKNLLRWATVLLFGGLGVYTLGYGARAIILHSPSTWETTAFAIIFILLFATLPLAIAYFAYHRRYRSLARLAAIIAAFVLFGALVPFIHALDHSLDSHRWLSSSPLSLGGVFQPMLGVFLEISPLLIVLWLLAWATRLIDRHLPAPEPTEAPPASVLIWQDQMQPVQRGVLRAGTFLVEWLGLLLRGLAFVGALVWILFYWAAMD